MRRLTLIEAERITATGMRRGGMVALNITSTRSARSFPFSLIYETRQQAEAEMKRLMKLDSVEPFDCSPLPAMTGKKLRLTAKSMPRETVLQTRAGMAGVSEAPE